MKKYEILFYRDYERDQITLIKAIKYIDNLEEFKKNFKYVIAWIKEL